MEISQNFVAVSEYMNFNTLFPFENQKNEYLFKVIIRIFKVGSVEIDQRDLQKNWHDLQLQSIVIG